MKNVCCFLLVLVFTSCTITKRVHNFGYHIEWKGRASVSKKSVDQHEGLFVEQSKVNGKDIQLNELETTEEENRSQENTYNRVKDYYVAIDREATALFEQRNNVKQARGIQTTTGTKPENFMKGDLKQRKLHPLVLFSLLCGITSVLLLTILIIGAISLGQFWPPIFIGMFLSEVASVILAFFGKAAINKDTGHFKGLNIAKALIVYGIIYYSLQFLGYLGLIIWFSLT